MAFKPFSFDLNSVLDSDGGDDYKKYQPIYGKKIGDPTLTLLDPASGKRRTVVGETFGNQYNANPEDAPVPGWGWLDENPESAWNSKLITDPNAQNHFTGLAGIVSNPAFYLSILGGGVAAGVGAGAGAAGAEAGAGGAFDMGVGSQGWMDYLGGQAGGSELLGGAGQDLLGGNMSYDDFGMPDYSSPDFNLENYPGMNPDAPNQYDSVMREAGINPSSPGAMQNLQTWLQNPSNLMRVAGNLGSSALSMFGANRQAGALQNLANQYTSYGGPSRARFDASMTPGFNPTSIPGYSGALDSASKAILARLSAGSGNPFGNPGGLIDAQKQIISGTALPAIQNYQALNANTGFGGSMQLGGMLGAQSIDASRGETAALASGLGSLVPQQSLAELLAQLKNSGFRLNEAL